MGRDQPDSFIGLGSPERHAAFVLRYVQDSVVASFDDLPNDLRLWAWLPEHELRERIVANLWRYNQETRAYIKEMVGATYQD